MQEKNINLPRVIVISNNNFSLSNSNGRTLGNLFKRWPKHKLAQFCIIPKDPYWEICDNYYCIEDRTVLKSFFKFKKAVGRQLHIQADDKVVDSAAEKLRANVGKKTLPKVLFREFIWSCNRWDSSSFRQWIDDFAPELIVIQLGDTCFTIDIAMTIAKRKNIPIIIHTTEGYYFFPYNWHYTTKIDCILFPFYKRYYKRKVEHLMSTIVQAVYLHDKLKKDYQSAFPHKAAVVYNGSELQPFDSRLFSKETPRISYLGNLGLDRDSALVEVGEVLQSIDTRYHIDVYGKASSVIQENFKKANGVNYHGLVDYNKVKEIIADSDILFHVETKKGYKERQLQYAFSTKIADSIASGKCFVLYAPAELACSEYIKETGAGWLVISKEQLRETILSIINDDKERIRHLDIARKVSEENHNMRKNAEKFQHILISAKN